MIEGNNGRAWRPKPSGRAGVSGGFFWLAAFFFVYCARPEDWIPLVGYLPLGKITAVFALVGLVSSLGKAKRTLHDFPVEFKYLAAMVGILFFSAVLSPVWKTGALIHTIDFSKILIAWALTFLLITDFEKLKRIIFVQSACVPLICAISVVKGHSMPRLEGVIGGIYANPNDLAFAIVLTLPFCLAFALSSKSVFRRLAWVIGMLIMGVALILTASRAGFIDLMISGTVCLWHFGVRGRRFTLIIGTVFATVLIMALAGKSLFKRFEAFTGEVETEQQGRAYESFELRGALIEKAGEGILHYPILGVGVRNFRVYSGTWHDVHVSYLQIAVEGGIPCLILYLLFFWRAFRNLRMLRKIRDLDVHTTLFVGGLHSSMVGFFVGALFAPEAYQFFPYFAVAYTSALVAIIAEQGRQPEPVKRAPVPYRLGEVYARGRKSNILTPVQ